MFPIRLILLTDRNIKVGKFRTGCLNDSLNDSFGTDLLSNMINTSFRWNCYDNELRLKEVEIRNIKEEMYQG